MKHIYRLMAAAVLFAAVPVNAIELSLEENRAERGSVGIVDMQRLFKASPDSARARESFEELVRQAEERVNARKAEILRAKQELAKLKLERDELAKSTPTAVSPLPAPVPVKTSQPAPVQLSTLPVTAQPPTGQPPAHLAINLPGLADAPLNLERPGSSPLNPTHDRGAPKPAPAPAVPLVSTPTAPVQSAGPTLAQRLLELDGLILSKQGDVDRLQAELDRERQGSESSLLNAESRKTDQVLARLYRAISEVAKREGVSVVMEKSTSLYGHPAVDLTDRVLKQLKGTGSAPQ